MIYAHYSSYRLGQVIQREKLKGRNKKLNKNLAFSFIVAFVHYVSQEMLVLIPCKDTELDKAGEF
jgi:hypothetical protein